MKIDKELFARRLREARQSFPMPDGHELTQEELAGMVGSNRRSVGNWEGGGNPPHRPKRIVIARELRVTLAWLEGQSDNPTDPASIRLPAELSGHSDYMEGLGVLGSRYGAARLSGANDARLLLIEREMLAVAENGLRREGKPENEAKQRAAVIVYRIKRASDPHQHAAEDAV